MRVKVGAAVREGVVVAVEDGVIVGVRDIVPVERGVAVTVFVGVGV